MVNYCLALPILPERGMELVKKFTQEHGGHNKEHDEFYKVAGITREQVWIQRSPPGSGAPDLEIVSIETNNPANTFKEFATSNHPWAVRFREFAKKACNHNSQIIESEGQRDLLCSVGTGSKGDLQL